MTVRTQQQISVTSGLKSKIDQFEEFHNQVINMPRDSFEKADLKKLQTIASYLYLLRNKFCQEGASYKDIMGMITMEIRDEHYPEQELRNQEYEDRYFSSSNLEDAYEIEGRMFRHLMSICSFFGLIKSNTRVRKVIDFDACRELILSKDSIIIPIVRTALINLNINDNDYIANLKGISLQAYADYRPAYSIMQYLSSIGRPATRFELAALLGRVDDIIQTEEKILDEAVKISKNIFTADMTQEQQIKAFFIYKNWTDENGVPFKYRASQEPYFKFNTFFLFMEALGLISINHSNNQVKLTSYSESLIQSEIPVNISDLDELLSKIDDYNEREADLADLIIYKRSALISKAITTNSQLEERMNIRSLKRPEVDERGRRKRNRLISEIAKIKAGYLCQATGNSTFKMPNGQYYIEAHHIIEFNGEEGPDVTENIIVLGPEKHKLLHHASKDEILDLYMSLKEKGVITPDRFRNMHNKYHCLKEKHVEALKQKGIISSDLANELLEMIRLDAQRKRVG